MSLPESRLFAGLLLSLLATLMCGVVCFPQVKQSDAPVTAAASLIIRIKQHGFFNGCSEVLAFSLQPDGTVEYDRCQRQVSAGGREAFALVRKKAAVSTEDAAALTRFVERSGFLGARERYHSGVNGTDVSWVTTMSYSGPGGGKFVAVDNYRQGSPGTPEFVHAIIGRAMKLLPSDAER